MNGLDLRNLSKPDIRFLENRAGKEASGLDIFKVSGDTNSVIAVTKQLRSTCKDFPDKGIAIAYTKTKDVLVSTNGVLSVCKNGKQMSGVYKTGDLKLDGKSTFFRLRRIEDLTSEHDTTNYQTIKPKYVPTPEVIGFLEKDLGYKLPSEYKQFLQTRGAVKYEFFSTIGLLAADEDDKHLSVTSVLDDINEFSEGHSVKLPKYALPIIEDANGSYILYLINTKKIASWSNDGGYKEDSGFSTIDEAMLEQIVDV